YNLGKSYLKNKQTGRARTAATEYLKLKPKEAKGYILIGDSYFQEQPPNYQLALENYRHAEDLNPSPRLAGRLAIAEGIAYRRMPNPNLTMAISKLEGGMKTDPGNTNIAVELGGAYLENKQDSNALTTTDRIINGK